VPKKQRLRRFAHDKHEDIKREIASEEVKSLQLIGCSYCKALTLDLLHKLLPILTLLLGGDGNQQVRNRGMKCISAAATRPVEL
jgi:hypothetical protein